MHDRFEKTATGAMSNNVFWNNRWLAVHNTMASVVQQLTVKSNNIPHNGGFERVVYNCTLVNRLEAAMGRRLTGATSQSTRSLAIHKTATSN